jgi:hypothetical protein
MAISGEDFEKLVKPFFRHIFEKMGYFVIEVRKQTSGTQNGFDIAVTFLDDNGKERQFFIECKYYTTSKLDWSEIVNKQIELEASNYTVGAFIVLSPLRDLSNIEDNNQKWIIKRFKFPVVFWTPDSDVKNLFALDKALYKQVFDKDCTLTIDPDEEIKKLKVKINLLINKCDALKFANLIQISDTIEQPVEAKDLRTTLDEKLNSIMDVDDEQRIDFHRIRANYKVYLEGLVDINSELRTQILNWESNLRLKANRLTKKFQLDDQYTPANFFHDFFDIAETEILTFYKDFELKGDKEKLLHGVIFELAAKCPLDWRKNG